MNRPQSGNAFANVLSAATIVLSCGISAVIAFSLRPQPAAPPPPILPDARIPGIEANLALLSSELELSRRSVKELRSKLDSLKVESKASLARLATDSQHNQSEVRKVVSVVNDLGERFRLGFLMRFRVIQDSERSALVQAMKSLEAHSFTLADFAAMSTALGSPEMACLLFNQPQLLKDGLIQMFSDDPNLGRLLKGGALTSQSLAPAPP